MINALDLKNNKKYYKKEICESILKEIELGIIQQDNKNKSYFTTKEYPVFLTEIEDCRTAKGNKETDLTTYDIAYIVKTLKQSNFKVEEKHYKDTTTVIFWINWSELLYENEQISNN